MLRLIVLLIMDLYIILFNFVSFFIVIKSDFEKKEINSFQYTKHIDKSLYGKGYN